ncbi:MAG: hypothetical protein A2W77_09470 [Nitrospinae bacterium RIFCSPLOWO2_12_39_16]|nr:MAG: hypothetical protein A2W77_09470 [Nitrospinae bacterium RIFCSPLOWO2_12_39_16]
MMAVIKFLQVLIMPFRVLLTLLYLALPSIVLAAGTITGVIKDKGGATVDTVVYIEDIAGEFAPPKEHLVMDQKNLTFTPHVMPILIGTTVNFINSDDVLNNIFTPSWAGRKFNLGTYPKGIVRSFTFDRLGEVVILCNIHPEMEAYIFVLSNPFFAVTDKTGKFTISGVPSGKYTLKTWHERLKPQTKQISVKENSTTVVDFELIR